MQNKNTLYLAQAGIIAAIYVALTVAFAPFAFREVQVRLAEALTILPVFTPAAVPGLFVGCLLGNVLGGAALPDVIFGSLATLIGASIYYLLVVVLFPGDKLMEIISQLVCITLVVVIRVLATKFKWNLPKAIRFSEIVESEPEKQEKALLK